MSDIYCSLLSLSDDLLPFGIWVWLNLAEHYIWDVGVVGSSPTTQTRYCIQEEGTPLHGSDKCSGTIPKSDE